MIIGQPRTVERAYNGIYGLRIKWEIIQSILGCRFGIGLARGIIKRRRYLPASPQLVVGDDLYIVRSVILRRIRSILVYGRKSSARGRKSIADKTIQFPDGSLDKEFTARCPAASKVEKLVVFQASGISNKRIQLK